MNTGPPTPAALRPKPPPEHRPLAIRAFALTWVGYAVFYLTRKNLSVVKTRLHEELGVSVLALGTIDTIYLVLYAAGQFINGVLGDRFGPRWVLGLGLIGSGAAAWCFGLSSSVVVFAAAFGLNGLFQSTGWPNTVKVMGAWFGHKSRGRVMGFWCTCYQVGGLAGTALATSLLIAIGWRMAFFIPGTLVAAMGAIILITLVERPQARGLKPVDQEPATPVGQETQKALSEADRAQQNPFMVVIRKPAIWALGISYFGLKLIRYSLLFWLPFYLFHELDYSEGAAGYLATAFEAGGILGAITTGWLSDRYFSARRARLLVPTLMVLAGALALYGLVGGMGVVVNTTCLALTGFLLFGPDALISGAAAQDVGGAEHTATAAGVINGMGSIGAIMQGALTAWISQMWGWDALFYVFVATAMLSALVLTPLAFRK